VLFDGHSAPHSRRIVFFKVYTFSPPTEGVFSLHRKLSTPRAALLIALLEDMIAVMEWLFSVRRSGSPRL